MEKPGKRLDPGLPSLLFQSLDLWTRITIEVNMLIN